MCGRYALTLEPDALLDELGLDDHVALPWVPRYNIAPTDPAPVVLRRGDGRLHVELFRWGLVPFWAEGPEIGGRLINARSETVQQKPAFRDAFKQRRCLIPASGFYEWRQEEHGNQPYWIHPEDQSLITFAGLWERWREPSGTHLYTFTILTTKPSLWVAPLHDRMPVILAASVRDEWLAGVENDSRPQVLPLNPYSGQLTAEPVSVLVNSPRNDDPECLVPVGPPLDPTDPSSGRSPLTRQGDLFE